VPGHPAGLFILFYTGQNVLPNVEEYGMTLLFLLWDKNLTYYYNSAKDDSIGDNHIKFLNLAFLIIF